MEPKVKNKYFVLLGYTAVIWCFLATDRIQIYPPTFLSVVLGLSGFFTLAVFGFIIVKKNYRRGDEKLKRQQL